MEEQVKETENDPLEEGAPEEQEAKSEPQAEERDYDTEARGMGWVPKDDFKGDPAKWVESDKFVERGENFIPFLRANNRKLEDQMAKQKSEFTQRLQRMEGMQKKSMASQQKQHETRLAEVKAAQSKAVKEGDEVEYQRLDAERDALQNEAMQTAEPEPPNNEDVQAQWVGENDWYNNNFEMAAAADNYSQFIARKSPTMSMSDNLAKVNEHIRGEFPEHFGLEKPKPKTTRTASVDGGSNFAASPFKTKAKGYSSLPDEAKLMCARDIADGLFKDQAEWTKEYYNG